MNLFEIFGNSFLVGLSGAMMPGPLLVVALARTPGCGARTGPIVIVGHAIVELITVAALSLGLAAIVGRQPAVARVIAVVGGMALLWMALTMLREIRRGVKAPEGAAKADNASAGVTALIKEGMIATVSNPYWFVWWATVGSALLVTSLKVGAIGAPVFYFGHILSDLVWYSTVTIVVWQGKNLFSGKRYHYLIGSCALFLIWLSGWFIYQGLTGAIQLS
jgi:threonine/homoserine/homoserine lactone efflux protein